MARLLEKDAVKVMRSAGLKPLVPYKSAATPWLSKCLKCGEEVTPSYSWIRRGGGCAFCSKVRFKSEVAIKIIEKSELNPITKFPGLFKPWECICKVCGNKVEIKFNPKRKSYSCLKCESLKPKKHKPAKQEIKYKTRDTISETEAIKILVVAGYKPIEQYPGNMTSKWKSIHLACGTELHFSLSRINQGERPCRLCNSRVIITDEVAKKYIKKRGIQPLERFKGTHKKWKCKCMKCKETINIVWHTALRAKTICKYCANRKMKESEINELLVKGNLKPLETFPGSKNPWLCKCLVCGKEKKIRLGDIKNGHTGCVYCLNKRVDEEDARALFISKGLTPIGKFPGAMEQWSSSCNKCKRKISNTYNNLKRHNEGCVWCAGQKLEINFILEKMAKAKLMPLAPYINALSKWKCRCLKCENIVYPKFGSIQSGNGGCKYCGAGGINLSQPAFIYLITNSELSAHKIGISGEHTQRMNNHKKLNWEEFKRKSFNNGADALDIEQNVLEWLNLDLGLKPYLNSSLMPQGGHTETVDASEIDLPTIWAKVEELSKVKR